MVLKNVFFQRNSLLILLALVLASNISLYHSTFGVSILPENPNGVVVGSIIDLAIISPLLFIAWRRNWNLKNIIITIAGGLVLVRFLIPIEYLKPFEAVTWVGFTVEGMIVLFEISLLILLVKYLPAIIRSVRDSSLPVLFSFSNAIDKHIKSTPLIIKIICTEMLLFYYAFLSWKKQPNSNENTFTLHKNSSLIAMQIMIIHSIVLETLVIHWWLHEKFFILSIILLVLNIYTVIFFIGDLQAIRHNALQTTKEGMFISLGFRKRMEVKWSNIEKIIDEPRILEQKCAKDTIEFIARDFELTSPHVIIQLKVPAKATLFIGKQKAYKFVSIRVDEPNKFLKTINDNINK
ncbi:beta-carotene 15,15'-monooxygenase [Pseudogracilibacillus auburnensis]|uniref:beta-carotene 15,15'-monooxygenase n=1 Tax=Pseudogracilibacillus auburnensis TaxID=1494959 RepID=UPI001A95EF08|nr:beta-carotene 15,15'-monooxygenase [Pseudogracilibacillus auburnensis]MBO1003014.1 beta-carotene 15,15'-monooxygenase [Pseudogracilibacillus auburnensis]